MKSDFKQWVFTLVIGLGASTLFAAPYVLNNNVIGDGTFSSSIASGSNGFSITVNGARIDFGAGASDYASSDGTTVSFASPLQGAGLYSSTGVTANTLATAPLDLSSDMNAATASSTVPAVRACPAVLLDANDLAFAVGQPGSCATEKFSVDGEGDVLAVGSLGLGTVMHWNATAPTIASGGCTSPSIVAGGDTALFIVVIGTSCIGVTDVVLTLPASSRVWNCFVNTDDAATRIVSQILSGSATSVTLRNFSRTTGLAVDWTASSSLQVSCVGGGG
jgi:hypothetical protein